MPGPPERRSGTAWFRSSRVWVGTVVAGVLVAMLNSGLPEVPGRLFDSSAAKDTLRRGPD